jgi:hypothetical protein
MRILTVAMLILLPSMSFGQKNLCRTITRTFDRKKGIITYKSPKQKHLAAIREFKEQEFFGLHLYMKCDHELPDLISPTVEFDDGSQYKEPGVKVKCDQEPTVIDNRYMGSGGTSYLVQAFMHLTQSNIVTFTSKRIRAVYFGDASAMVSETDGEKMKAFIRCLAEKEKP